MFYPVKEFLLEQASSPTQQQRSRILMACLIGPFSLLSLVCQGLPTLDIKRLLQCSAIGKTSRTSRTSLAPLTRHASSSSILPEVTSRPRPWQVAKRKRKPTGRCLRPNRRSCTGGGVRGRGVYIDTPEEEERNIRHHEERRCRSRVHAYVSDKENRPPLDIILQARLDNLPHTVIPACSLRHLRNLHGNREPVVNDRPYSLAAST